MKSWTISSREVIVGAMSRCHVLAITIGAGLAACHQSEPAPPPPPTETNVELVARGSAPQRVLRYHVAKGVKTTMDVGVQATVMGRVTPQIVTTMDFSGEDVLPDGRMQLASVVRHTTATTADGAVAPPELTSVFDGITIRATITPVGTLADAKVDLGGKQLAPELDGQVQSLTKGFEQAAMILPEGPVGVGAVWRTRRTIEQNKMTMTAITTVTITKLDGDRVGFTRETAISGPDQTVAQDDVKVALTHIVGSGKASGTIDLATFAITSTADDEYHADARDAGSGSDTAADLQKLAVSMHLTMTPK